MGKSKKNTKSSSIFMESVRNNLGLGAAFLVLFVGASLLLRGTFFAWNNFSNVLRQLSTNMFLACGMTFVIMLGGIDLSVGSVIAMVGCFSAGFISYVGMPSGVAVVLAVLIGVLVGLFNGFLAAFTTIPPFIITLSTMNICRGIARVYSNTKTITVSDKFFKSIAATYIGAVPIQVVYIVIVIIVTAIILNRTQLGRQILATGGNKQAAAYSGVNTKKVTIFVFAYSGFLASLAAVIQASRLFSGTHTAGEGAEMDAIAAVVLGGTSMSGGLGSISGTVIGVFVIAVMNNVMNLYGIDSSWQYIVKGIVILIAVSIDYFRGLKKS
ncbi:MAG: ABC transporter permease [Lachnospiraceae bacterium]|jgi:ribose transport system permease protein|nr:ABC transporter permease [Lachnospiraceae bacterium]